MTGRTKKTIKIKFQNGFSFQAGVKEILSYVADRYDFVESADPDFIIFGPYGNDFPAKSDKYVRIGYFCENFAPDMTICEWGFGIPREQNVRHPKYKKIQWHNLDPESLVKMNFDVDKIMDSKTKFCNFLFSNRVPFREAFFKALSKYKKIDAPSDSMNNMPKFDSLYSGDVWDRKRQFLHAYKFTIAFENLSFPGYQTEKLYDPMLAQSIPIYYGDAYVHETFNPKSFINAIDYLQPNFGALTKFIEKQSQMTLRDFRPGVYNSIPDHIARKSKIIGRRLKMRLELNGFNYKKLVDRIVEIDENDNLYREILAQPWFHDNRVPTKGSAVDRWVEIFG